MRTPSICGRQNDHIIVDFGISRKGEKNRETRSVTRGVATALLVFNPSLQFSPCGIATGFYA